jgi:hypothetical protein
MILLRTATIGVITAALLGLASGPPATAAAGVLGATASASESEGGSVSHVDDSIHARLEGDDVVIDMSAGLLQSRTRIVVLVNDRYIGETYSGSAYYASRRSIGERVLLTMGPARAGDHLEVSVISGRPGDPLGSRYGRYPLLEEDLRSA